MSSDLTTPAAAPGPLADAPLAWNSPRQNPLGLALLASEISVMFRRRRTLAMLGAIALIPILIAIAVRVSSSRATGRGPAFLDQISQNGLFVSFVAMVVAIPLFLPLTVGVVAGDTIAGEAGGGTLRYLLVAPAGRVRLLVVKYLGTAVFCVAASLTVIVFGTLIGVILFPTGPVTLLSGDTVSVGESLLRSLLVASYVTISLLGLSMIGLFISTLTDVPVGSMAATVVMAVASQVLDQLPQLDWLHPFLFSHYWLSFADLLRQPISWDSYGSNAVVQGAYMVIFGALAYGRFSAKDILS